MKVLDEIKAKVSTVLPDKCQVKKVELEGPEVAIYTTNPKAFFEDENFVAKLAFELKKRVNIRTDKSLLLEPEEAKKKIAEIVPEDAQIKDITFTDAFSEVVIDCIKPGLVIGKGGETSKRIILETGWTPKIIRAPTSPSKILVGIRQHINKYASERKKILQKTAEHIYREETPSLNDWVRMVALGSFREVGRSCILIETPKTKVLMDCGINVANENERYPFLDAMNFSVNEIDAIIVSHAHLDHSGFVPYLFKLGFQGPVYCTEPTRDLMTLLQFDYIDVLVKEGREPPYNEQNIKEMAKYVITRDYREVTDISPDIRMTFHNAAHILGSASVHLHIGDGMHNLVYSADIKYGFTRLFNNVDIKYPRLETLILESTYGSKDDIMPNRQDAEDKLLQIINDTVSKDGSILIPVFAVGRAQEILLVLENFYKQGLIDTRIIVDGMTREASAIHTAYPEYLRKGVQRRVLQNDSPFTAPIFEEIDPKNREDAVNGKPSIILASSGMMTGGPSLQYFHHMAENPANALIFVGYQGEGSMGRKIQSGIKELPIMGKDGKTKALKINMRVDTVEGFSGHSDRNQLSAYIRNLKPKPKRLFVNHGEKSKCIEFSKFVASRFHINAMSLRNLDAVRLK